MRHSVLTDAIVCVCLSLCCTGDEGPRLLSFPHYSLCICKTGVSVIAVLFYVDTLAHRGARGKCLGHRPEMS